MFIQPYFPKSPNQFLIVPNTPEEEAIFLLQDIPGIKEIVPLLQNRPKSPFQNHDSFHPILLATLKNPGDEKIEHLMKLIESKEGVLFCCPNHYYTADWEPEYPTYYSQYALSTIQAQMAWYQTTGSHTVRVGVIDSGLANNIELLGNKAPGVDFADSDPSEHQDVNGHGTAVAGVIGANGIFSMTGVSPKITMIPLRIISNQNLYDSVAVIQAIDYAIGHRIPILNYCYSSDRYNRALETAIQNYTGLFVCSAGNNGRNIDIAKRYPPSLLLDHMLVVGASDENDHLIPSSDYGVKTVHLCAPGKNIFSIAAKTKGYTIQSGTSMATPFVTGTAALLLSLFPSLSALQLKQAILQGTEPVSWLEDKVSSGGRLNVFQALNAAKELVSSSER